MTIKFVAAFSDAAVQYDVLTGLHKEIGREPRESRGARRQRPHFGCRDGNRVAHRPVEKLFSRRALVGIDFAAGMVDAAKMREKDCAILQADARQMPFKKNTFEMIASNLAYQWVGDLPKAFANCHVILKEEGKLYLTMFGYSTFQELFEALEKTCDATKGNIALPRLADRGQICDALSKAGFRDVNVEEESIKVHFPDMLALVKWVKDIGANALMGDMFIGRDWLNRANAYYTQTFADQWGVGATFQVIWVQAKK